MSLPAWLDSQGSDKFLVRIKAVPNASKTTVTGVHGDRLKIKVASPPVDGKANEALIAYLSEKLKIRKAQIDLIRGHTAPIKDFLITGVFAEQFDLLLKV